MKFEEYDDVYLNIERTSRELYEYDLYVLRECFRIERERREYPTVTELFNRVLFTIKSLQWNK